MAEEGFRDAVASVVVELLKDKFHLRDHFGTAEFGDDEVVGENGITIMILRVEEDLKSERWILLGSEEGGESERSYGF